MPRRIVTILEGESLVNDATAIVCLRSAVAAIVGTVTALGVAGDFLRSVVGGARRRRRRGDPVRASCAGTSTTS